MRTTETVPDPVLDKQEEEAWFAAIQPGATNADIDNFLIIHQQVVDAAECGKPCEQ